jgi:hypothetical protein
MYKGEFTKGIEFYNLLIESKEFTSELGKVTMASGKLEAELILFLKKKGITSNISRVTLGGLIKIGVKNNFFDNNLIITLNEINKQRNDVTHKIYALFIDLPNDSKLEKDNLLDTDVITYIDIVWQLKENINHIADHFRKNKI